MAKTKYEKELGEQSQATLVYMCEGKGLLHTGNREALIARLVEAEPEEAAKAEPEPEPETQPEPEVVPPAPEPETPEPEE